MAGKADQPHLVRDMDIHVFQRTQRAHALYIHGGHDCIQVRVLCQKFFCTLIAVFKAIARFKGYSARLVKA